MPNSPQNTLAKIAGSALKSCGTAVAVTFYGGAAGFQGLCSRVKGVFTDDSQEDLQQTDFNWLENALFYKGNSLETIREKVHQITKLTSEELNETSSSVIADNVCDKLIQKSAFKTGAVGGLTSFPGAIPGIGTVGTLAVGLTSDLVYLLRSQIELCYAIAVACNSTMEEEELQAVSLALIGLSSEIDSAESVSTQLTSELVDKAARSYLAAGVIKSASMLFNKIGSVAGRRSAKVIPFLGIPLGSSLNHTNTTKVGKHAKRYFASYVHGH